jgi:hypothetical protein
MPPLGVLQPVVLFTFVCSGEILQLLSLQTPVSFDLSKIVILREQG